MQSNTDAPTSGVVLDFPPAPIRGRYTVAEICAAYMAQYQGRDTSRVQRVGKWVALLGTRIAADLDADDIADTMDVIAHEASVTYRGKDKQGKPIFVDRGPRCAATINRYKATFAAVLSWAKKRRLMPRGWTSPARDVPTERESNGRVRFLSRDEQQRLLAVARVSRNRKLHLAILFAITTGCRKGEMLGLRFADIDLENATATLHRTKNGESRTLVLTPQVVAEMRRQGVGLPGALVFAQLHKAERPMVLDTAWRNAMRQAHIEDFHWHDLRHTHASALAQSGASLLEIADSMGHKSLTMTKRYSHLTIDNKRRLIERVLGNVA